MRKSTYGVSLSSNKKYTVLKANIKVTLSINHITTTGRWNVQRA